jgi:hypothetical protein
MKISAAVATALIAALLPPAAAQADGGWEYRITPYLWLPTLSGDLAIGASPPASSDASLLEVLEFGFLATGEARKGDWGILGEFNYLSLSQDASWGNRLDADVKLKGGMGALAVAYRFAKDDAGWADVFGGLRAWSVKPEIDFDRLPSVSKKKSWVDPIVGLRGRYALTETTYLSALGDIGGFHLGSRFQWEIVGSVGYQFSDTVSAELGGRYLSIDFKDGGVILDTQIRGPFVALNFTF